MEIDLAPLAANTRYHLMTQTIIPRPIAWVLTANQQQQGAQPSYNLAPFSFFNALCSNPPLVMLSAGKKAEGQPKDTRENILQGEDFVIHIPSVHQADDVTASAATLDYGDSELLTLRDSELVEFPNCPLPRLASCPVAFHARLYDVHYLGPAQQAIIYAELKQLYVTDEALQEASEKGRYYINAQTINPLARLGGTYYAGLGESFKVPRPE